MIDSGTLQQVFRWLYQTFGKDVLVWASDNLRRQWARTFASKPVLFLGPKKSGKSSLICLLRKGKPYDVDKDGTIRTPDPTLVAAIVDKKISVNQANWLSIKQDLPGDQQLRATWIQSVKDFHPVGIIYLIDGSDENKIAEEVREAGKEVLDVCYPEGPQELCAFHIFISFSDRWGHSSTAIRSRQHAAQIALEDEISARPAFAGLRTGVAVMHLSPHEQNWKEAERAVEHFGTDLVR